MVMLVGGLGRFVPTKPSFVPEGLKMFVLLVGRSRRLCIYDALGRFVPTKPSFVPEGLKMFVRLVGRSSLVCLVCGLGKLFLKMVDAPRESVDCTR